jgi:SAM-dependent methyltransferase
MIIPAIPPCCPHRQPSLTIRPMSNPNPYQQFARYYDLYVGDFAADLPLYRALCEPTHKVLEIGCGTGRVLFPLLQQGCTVTGVDTSPDMLRAAEAKLNPWIAQGKLVLMNHDFCQAPLPERFDRVLLTFFTFNFNYLLTASAQEHFLRHIRHSLAPDGILVMDLFFPQPLAKPAISDQPLAPDEATDSPFVCMARLAPAR